MMVTDSNKQSIAKLEAELRWLNKEIKRQPTEWLLCRVAEVEGQLAGYMEDSAWNVTRMIVKRLQTAN